MPKRPSGEKRQTDAVSFGVLGAKIAIDGEVDAGFLSKNSRNSSLRVVRVRNGNYWRCKAF